MSGSADIPQEFIDRIAEWFCLSFPDPYRNPRMDKSLGLYQLAGLVKRGALVELGAYQGNGAVSLAAGTGGSRITYTIDDFKKHRDWMGNEPGRADKALLKLNIEESKLPIIWLDKSVDEAAAAWTIPLGLVFWDTGTRDIRADFEAWSKFLVPGGMFVMHDTDDHTFCADEIMDIALRDNWLLGPAFRTLYTVIKPSDTERITS